MKKKKLIGSIIAVVILTLVSFSSVVGYQSVESDIDVSVEENKEVFYQDEPSDEDCGCEDDSSDLGWNFPVLCSLLYPFWTLVHVIYASTHYQFGEHLVETMTQIGESLNCYWIWVPPR